MKDYHYILGVPKTASFGEIKKAYHKLSTKFHPDKNEGDKFFEERFKEINEAYEYLSKSHTYNKSSESANHKKEEQSKEQPKSENKVPDPEIIKFEVNKNTILEGDTLILTWETKHCSQVELKGIGKVNDFGTKSFLIQKIHNETAKSYELHVKNIIGISIYKVVQVNFKPKPNKEEIKETILEKESKNTILQNSDNNLVFILIGLCVLIAFILLLSKPNNNLNEIINPKTNSQSSSSNKPETNTFNKSEQNNPLNARQTVSKFFEFINLKKFPDAYLMTKNELWKPYQKFVEIVWANFDDIKINSISNKDYFSKFGADSILQIDFSAYDTKANQNITKSFDFHLRKEDNKYYIVRMINPKSQNSIDIDALTLRLVNPQYALIQDYYDLFKDKDKVKQNSKSYYADKLISFHGKVVNSEEANKLDYLDFIKNDIQSYEIKANSYAEITFKEENYDLVSIPINFKMNYISGESKSFTKTIDFILNKENTKILAIGENLDISKLDLSNLKDENQNKYKIINNLSNIINLHTGDTPYKNCFGSNNSCDDKCSEIVVIASSTTDVIVIVKSNNSVVRHAYISKGESYTFNLKNGSYQVFFYSGKNWDSNKEMESENCSSLSGGFSSDEYFSKDDPQYLFNKKLTYELILQQNGNFKEKSSSSKEVF